MVFANEKALVNTFVSRLERKKSPWGPLQVATEFNYQRGRTDIVACTQDQSVIAIEAKLKDWRYALHQAFRNRCFAHWSYVLLPKQTALNASRYAGEFVRRQVGICYLANSEIVVLQFATKSAPFEPWLCRQAKMHIGSHGAQA